MTELLHMSSLESDLNHRMPSLDIWYCRAAQGDWNWAEDLRVTGLLQVWPMSHLCGAPDSWGESILYSLSMRGRPTIYEGKTYSESWRIIDRASKYNPITKRCNLCLKEKVYIIFHRNLASLNKRVLAEFYQPCLHRFQTFLAKA